MYNEYIVKLSRLEAKVQSGSVLAYKPAIRVLLISTFETSIFVLNSSIETPAPCPTRFILKPYLKSTDPLPKNLINEQFAILIP